MSKKGYVGGVILCATGLASASGKDYSSKSKLRGRLSAGQFSSGKSLVDLTHISKQTNFLFTLPKAVAPALIRPQLVAGVEIFSQPEPMEADIPRVHVMSKCDLRDG
jgi:hypothetical protein